MEYVPKHTTENQWFYFLRVDFCNGNQQFFQQGYEHEKWCSVLVLSLVELWWMSLFFTSGSSCTSGSAVHDTAVIVALGVKVQGITALSPLAILYTLSGMLRLCLKSFELMWNTQKAILKHLMNYGLRLTTSAHQGASKTHFYII